MNDMWYTWMVATSLHDQVTVLAVLGLLFLTGSYEAKLLRSVVRGCSGQQIISQLLQCHAWKAFLECTPSSSLHALIAVDGRLFGLSLPIQYRMTINDKRYKSKPAQKRKNLNPFNHYFSKIGDIRTKFCRLESLPFEMFPAILTHCETYLTSSIPSSNFSILSCLPLGANSYRWEGGSP